MKNTIILLVLICYGCGLWSQSIDRSVVSVAGHSDAGPTILLDWTMGEIAVQTLTARSGWITEGFHQPILWVEPLLPESDDLQIEVFPNPTHNELSISLRSTVKGTFGFVFRDLAGKELLRRQRMQTASPSLLNLAAFPRGIYLLTVDPHDGSWPQTFRIVKAR